MASRTLSTDEKETVLKMAGVLIRTSDEDRFLWVAENETHYYAASFSSRANCIDTAFKKLMRENQNEQTNTN